MFLEMESRLFSLLIQYYLLGLNVHDGRASNYCPESDALYGVSVCDVCDECLSTNVFVSGGRGANQAVPGCGLCLHCPERLEQVIVNNRSIKIGVLKAFEFSVNSVIGESIFLVFTAALDGCRCAAILYWEGCLKRRVSL